VVGAEEVLGGGALQPPGDGHLQRVQRRVDEAQRRRRHQPQRDGEADHERHVPEGSASQHASLPSLRSGHSL
jgi:hypothetical protein